MGEKSDKYDYGPYSETAREAGPIFTALAVTVFFPLFFLMMFSALSYLFGAHWPVEFFMWILKELGFDPIYSIVPAAVTPAAQQVQSVTLLSDTATVQVQTQRPIPRVRFTDDLDIKNLHEVTEAVAQRHDLRPGLLYSVMKAESAHSTTAVSHAGALGLMQLMPKTAESLDIDPYSPLGNIRGGAIYLRKMLDRFDGELRLALAAYNAGPGAVKKYEGIPPYDETQTYILRVLKHYQRFLKNQSP